MPALPISALVCLLAIAGCRADAAPNEGDASDLALSTFQSVPGTAVLTADLANSSKGRGSRSSGYTEGTGGTRNVLFFDAEKREGRWLFPSNAALILSRDVLRASGDSSTRALVFRVVSRDTDGDDKLTTMDDHALVVVSADGTGRRTLADGVAQDLGHFRVSPEAVVYTFITGGEPAAVELDLGTLESREIALPPIPVGAGA